MAERVSYRTCPLCEATCGLQITSDGDRVVRVRPDQDDVFSKGFICPKGASIAQLHDDPDRLRTPMVKQPDGTFAAASWDQAFALINERLPALIAEHGRDAVGFYLGNPSAHHLGPSVYSRVLIKATGTRNVFSASTVDQYPKQMASAHMFGSAVTVPVPDIDRTEFLLILGANPLASNGSLMTAPDVRGRLRAIQARGGKVVVVDPRRTRTAALADEHLFIRPGTDALLLFALAHVIFAEGLDDLGAATGHVSGVEELRELARGFSPAAVSAATGIKAAAIERIARELAAAPSAAVYGRIGTTTTRFGGTTSWLIDVINTITGNLDRPGGAMFTTPAAGGPNTKGEPGRGRGARPSRFTSRVRGLPDVLGEIPVAALAEEIEAPGEGQIRALLTVAGNPVVSTPNSERLAAALDTLDFMVSLDLYINETTRHADVILPAPSPLEDVHYDLFLYPFAVRNIANWSEPTFAGDVPDEWETLLRLTGVVTGQGPSADVAAIDRFVISEAVKKEIGDERSPAFGLDLDAIVNVLGDRGGPRRLVDLMLRCGPFGAGFPELGVAGPGLDDAARETAGAAAPDGLSLPALLAAEHGVDLGPLRPRLPEVLRTASGTVELAPAALVIDVERLAGEIDAEPAGMTLIGRRDLRSNNSWMHNLPGLVSGPARCTVLVHPEDAATLSLVDGEPARVSARTGAIELPVQVSEEMMRGVVSIPHGWGHDLDGVQMGVAGAHAGANSNVLTDELEVEPLTGTAVLNGIPVTLAPVAAAVGVG